MSRSKSKVLIVDDEEEIRDSLELLLSSEGLSVETIATGEEGLEKVEQNLYDVVLLDLMLPGRSGLEIQRDLKGIDPTLPVVIITAMAAIETAVDAIRSGAYDYVTKPWNNEKLMVIINNAIKQRRLHSENQQLRRALKERFGYSNIIGKSDRMLGLLDLVTQVAASRSTILIQGESGTGKGTRREGYSPEESASRQAVRAGQQRQHAGRPAREHAVRPRPWSVYQRRGNQKGSVRDRRFRDDLFR